MKIKIASSSDVLPTLFFPAIKFTRSSGSRVKFWKQRKFLRLNERNMAKSDASESLKLITINSLLSLESITYVGMRT